MASLPEPGVLGGMAHLAPHVFGHKAFAVQLGLGQLVAPVVSFLLSHPGFAGRLAHIFTALMLGQQAVTVHLAVVIHLEARHIAAEGSPVAAAAQFQQPVIPQPVFYIAAGPASIKSFQLFTASLGQAQVQRPIIHPGGQGVACVHDGTAHTDQFDLVFTGEGLARFADQVICVGLRLNAEACSSGG